MTRDEMIARGLVPAETKHNNLRRAHFHDYNRPGLYMVTLVVAGRQRVFGHIEGHTRGQRGSADYPHLHCSALGERVLQEEVAKIPQYYPMVDVCKVALMPDHIHLLVRVRRRLPDGKHLGNIVRGFKTGCTRAWWRLQDEAGGSIVPGAFPLGGTGIPGGEAPGTGTGAGRIGGEARGTAGGTGTGVLRPVLFEGGYHDRIIIREGMLENICRYMDENPFRARLREERPLLMERRLHLRIDGHEYAAFGNLFLLKNPDKEQVFFHRKNAEGTPTHLTPEYEHAKAALLRRAEEGAVLVTPGISLGEKGVVSAALAGRLPLILLQKEPITEYWKPPQGRFYACASGELLILAPWQLGGDSDYARFHELNDLARSICEARDTRLVADI